MSASRDIKSIDLPLTDETIAELRTGDSVALYGPVFTIRDASSRRLSEDIEAGQPALDLKGQLVFYMGPAPAPPGRPAGAIGPTTSRRMDAYVPMMVKAGVKGFIGKGRRSEQARRAMAAGQTVYLVAIGGTAALLSRHVGEAAVAAYPDLGPEAIYRFVLDGLPVVVADDIYGGDLFAEEWAKWRTRAKASS